MNAKEIFFLIQKSAINALLGTLFVFIITVVITFFSPEKSFKEAVELTRIVVTATFIIIFFISFNIGYETILKRRNLEKNTTT